MKQKKLFEYGIDFLYLVGGLIILGAGGYFARFGVGLDNDGDALVEQILLSAVLFISGFFYIRYAFHLNYPNKYTRASMLLILCSYFPYSEFSSVSFDGNMDNYLLSIVAIFGTFILLLVSGLVLLFVGYMKGRTDLENIKALPVKN